MTPLGAAAALAPPAILGGYTWFVFNGRLSPHFTVMELVTSKTGGIQWPGPCVLRDLEWGVTHVLEPWRALVGPLAVTSGYRTWRTNEAVGGSDTSDHPQGRAVDVVAIDLTPEQAADALIDSDIPYDQLIVYDDGHIHVGWRRENPRRQVIWDG